MELIKIKEKGINAEAEITEYFMDFCFGVSVKFLWTIGDKDYFAIRENHPMDSNKDSVFVIYLKDETLWNENDEDLIKMNFELN